MFFKFIIFLIILWQVRTVLKKVFEKAASQSTPADGTQPQKISWQEKLKTVAETMKAQMEAEQKRQTENASPKTPEWDKIRPGKKKSPQAPKKKEGLKVQQKTGTKEPSSKKTTAMPGKARYQEFIPPEDDAMALSSTLKKEPEKQSGPKPQKIQKRLDDICRVENLAKAIVWSEIIAPPLSIREESRPFRDFKNTSPKRFY